MIKIGTVPPFESLMRIYHCRGVWLKKIFETPNKGDWLTGYCYRMVLKDSGLVSAARNMRW